MAKKQYDVAIVGTGPAGMFAALRIMEIAPTLRVVMFEKGARRSLAEMAEARTAYEAGRTVNVTEGWGGAGAFSDGKYNLDEQGLVGGRLVTDRFMPRVRYVELLNRAAGLYVHYGAQGDRVFGKTFDAQQEHRVAEIRRLAAGHDMRLHQFPIMHLGTSNAHRIVENVRGDLESLGVEIVDECRVDGFARDGSGWRVLTSHGEYVTRRVIACPGRSGAAWFRQAAEKVGIALDNNGVDIGVRVETSMDVMAELCALFYESKFYLVAKNDDRIRTFCMCPNGHVAVEQYRDTGIFCANGHTDPDHPSDNCNFAVLQTQVFTRPFKDPLAYGIAIAELHTMLAGGERQADGLLSGGGVLVQRLGDLLGEHRTTEHRLAKGIVQPTCTESRVIPGDIRLAMPARFVTGIVRFLQALDAIAPGIGSRHTLLYSPEIKFNAVMARAAAERGFEVMNVQDEPLTGFHVAGDGAGYTRGLNGASAHGLAVGEYVANSLLAG